MINTAQCLKTPCECFACLVPGGVETVKRRTRDLCECVMLRIPPPHPPLRSNFLLSCCAIFYSSSNLASVRRFSSGSIVLGSVDSEPPPVQCGRQWRWRTCRCSAIRAEPSSLMECYVSLLFYWVNTGHKNPQHRPILSHTHLHVHIHSRSQTPLTLQLVSPAV